MTSRLILIKEPQTTLQNKETTVQSYRKMLNQNTKKSPGIGFAICNCTEEMGMDNEPAKKIYVARTFTVEPLPSPYKN